MDTGSEVSLMKESLVQPLQLERRIGKNIPQLHGISGQKLRVLGHANATITVGNHEPMEVKFIIVPDHYLSTSVLLGMNVLTQVTLTLDHNRGHIIWNNTTYPLKYQEHQYGKIKYIAVDKPPIDNRKSKNFIRLTSKFKIKPYTTTMIETKMDEPPHTMLVVKPKHQYSQRGLPIVTKVTPEQTIYLPVVNNTKQSIILHPGILLADYEVMTENNLTTLEEASCLKTTIRDAIGPENDVMLDDRPRQEKLQQILQSRDWSHLEPEQKDKLFHLVLNHDPLFIVEKNELGSLQTTPAHINLTNPQPCRAPIYRYPEKAKDLIAEILKDLESRDIIENSTAAWLSPIVLVNKSNGEKRMCLDYRKVNKHLAVDIHPLPKLEELVENVSGHGWYATLDLKDAYYQVMLDEESRDITTFSEGVSLYRFKRLPFGLSCSAAIFTRQLNAVLAPLLKEKWVSSYLDDIIVYSNDFNTLLNRLDKLFSHMKKVGIKLNLSKCDIGQREIKFLGHIVSKDGYRPDPANIEPIRKMKPPTTVKETRRFLGMCSFYRRHIHQFSKLVAPLTNLTRKGCSFEWSPDCQQAFETIKDKMTQAPILGKANLSKEFILETDASLTHVGAVLMQRDQLGVPRVIAYFSKKLRPAEMRYSTTDREALAVILACRQFNHFLWGTKVIIKTDHQPLVSIFRSRTKSPRMARWVLEMRDYQYKIEYKSGKKNLVADQLSRPVRYVRPVRYWDDTEELFLGKTKDEFIELQNAELRWREMKEYLEGGRVPRAKYPRSTLNQFIVEDGILYFTKQKLDNTLLYVLVVPNELKKQALLIAHEKESGHLGQLKSILKAEDLFYWPNLRVDMRRFVKECVTCQQTKYAKGLQTRWQELPPCQQPLERISIDITEMSPSNSGHRYVLTIVDHYSRYVKFLKLRSRMAEEVGRNLDMYMGDFGAPKVLLADNARKFHATQIKELLRNYVTYHP